VPRHSPIRALFAVAAGPRTGFGHLVRARSLARALGIVPIVVLRGTSRTRRRAELLGCRVVSAGSVPALRHLAPDVVVVDDPSAAAVAAWVRRARRANLPVATVHDLGIAAQASDLIVDGSLAPNMKARGRFATLNGPDYMILDPAILGLRQRGVRGVARRPRVLIALGGGDSAAAALPLARLIAARAPTVEVVTAGGFVGNRRGPNGLAADLARATVAVVAGGVTLYEACALGVPTVAVAVGSSQHVTIRAMARRGATIDGGRWRQTPSGRGGVTPEEVARQVERLLADTSLRRRMARSGRRVVDGRGALRVGEWLRQLVGASQRARHVA
jgi:spore coat polysaccharide biosynthesis predicted glycosyltransferase SpsG